MLTTMLRQLIREKCVERRLAIGLCAAAFFCFSSSAYADVVLQGTVTDRDSGQPLVGAKVYLQSGAVGDPAAITDGNGSYAIDSSQISGTSGPIVFQAAAHFVVQTVYDVSTPPVTLDVSLLAATTPLVQGTVRDEATTLPIASASLSFANGSFSAIGSGPVATTDASGLYAFDASLFFESASTGFDSSLTASAAGYFSKSDPLSTYAPPFPITQDFSLLPSTGTVLQGTVTDRDSGQPLVGAKVYLQTSAAGSPAASTDGNGTYTIDGSQVSSTSGPIVFQAAAHFVVQTSYDITTIPTTLDVTLLGAATPLVQGTVRDSATALPIASASLSFANGSFSAVGSGPAATSDGNGLYAFDASLFFESASTGFGSVLTASATAYVSQDGPSSTYAPPFPITQDFNLVWDGTTRDITITTNPANLTITADSLDYVAPHVFAWIPGSPHTVAVGSPQSGPAGTQYRFGSWSDGGGASHSISTPNAHTTITAQFITQYLLTTAVAPALGGAVTSGGWFDSDTVVSIAATPAAGYQFSGFGGDLSGTDNPQNVTMNAAKSVTANFSPVTFRLRVSITGSGSGTVTSDDGQINCPGDCEQVYDNGSMPTLTATAGGSSTFTGWSGDTCTGTPPCTITIDADKNVTATFVVSGRDLVVGAVSNPPGAASPGSSYVITDTTLNQGSVPAGISTTRFYLSLDPVKSASDVRLTGLRTVPSLAAGAELTGPTTVTIPATTAVGTYFQLACADDKKDVTETNEGNNCRASTTTIQVALPDLLETAVSDPPPTIAPGGKFTITDTVLDQSAIGAAATTTRYYLSIDAVKDAGDLLLTGTRSVPILAAGASSQGSKQVTVPSTTPFATYRLLACADDLTKVGETDETNNCLAASNSVIVGLPDLITTLVYGSGPSDSFPPSAPGLKVTVFDRVVNQGNVIAAASSTRYYLSVDVILDAGDVVMTGSRGVPMLAPGVKSTASKKVTVPTTTPANTYHVIACADDLKKVAESDEGNNCLTSTATIVIGP